jgi:4-hydroxybenzoate polyprenyltransferase
MDVEGDEKTGTMTIPVVIGISSIIKLILVLNSTMLILICASMR